MSRDAPPASAHAAGHEFSWTMVERGSFLFGRCDECGFVSPARRARYSTDADMGAHAVICHANRTLDVIELRAEVQHQPVEHQPVEPAGVPG